MEKARLQEHCDINKLSATETVTAFNFIRKLL